MWLCFKCIHYQFKFYSISRYLEVWMILLHQCSYGLIPRGLIFIWSSTSKTEYRTFWKWYKKLPFELMFSSWNEIILTCSTVSVLLCALFLFLAVATHSDPLETEWSKQARNPKSQRSHFLSGLAISIMPVSLQINTLLTRFILPDIPELGSQDNTVPRR